MGHFPPCWSLKTKRVFWGKFWCIGCMYADPKTFTEMSGHSIKVDFGIRSEQGNNIKVKNCKSWPCCGFSSIKLTRKAFACFWKRKNTILISNKQINCRNEKWKQFTRLPERICYSYICMLQLQRMEANQNLNEIRLLYPQTW